MDTPAVQTLTYALARRRFRWRLWAALLSLLVLAALCIHFARAIHDQFNVHLAYRRCLRELPHPSGIAYCYDRTLAPQLAAAHPDMLVTRWNGMIEDVYFASAAWDAWTRAPGASFPRSVSQRTTPSNWATLYLGERTAPDGGRWLVCVEFEQETSAERAVFAKTGSWARPMLHFTCIERPPLLRRPRVVHTTSATALPHSDLPGALFLHAHILIKPGVSNLNDTAAFSLTFQVTRLSQVLDATLGNDGSLTLSLRPPVAVPPSH